MVSTLKLSVTPRGRARRSSTNGECSKGLAPPDTVHRPPALTLDLFPLATRSLPDLDISPVVNFTRTKGGPFSPGRRMAHPTPIWFPSGGWGLEAGTIPGEDRSFVKACTTITYRVWDISKRLLLIVWDTPKRSLLIVCGICRFVPGGLSTEPVPLTVQTGISQTLVKPSHTACNQVAAKWLGCEPRLIVVSLES